MNLFAALRQRRQPAQGFGQAKAAPEADSAPNLHSGADFDPQRSGGCG
jgi:hypothetical protein